jgi:hypothetical protein
VEFNKFDRGLFIENSAKANKQLVIKERKIKK